RGPAVSSRCGSFHSRGRCGECVRDLRLHVGAVAGADDHMKNAGDNGDNGVNAVNGFVGVRVAAILFVLCAERSAAQMPTSPQGEIRADASWIRSALMGVGVWKPMTVYSRIGATY